MHMVHDVLHETGVKFSNSCLEDSIPARQASRYRAGWLLRASTFKPLAWVNKLRQPCPTTPRSITTSSQDNSHRASYQFTLKLFYSAQAASHLQHHLPRYSTPPHLRPPQLHCTLDAMALSIPELDQVVKAFYEGRGEQVWLLRFMRPLAYNIY